MMNTLGKDTMESDLWSFDDEDREPDQAAADPGPIADPEGPAAPDEEEIVESQTLIEEPEEAPAAAVDKGERAAPAPVLPAPRSPKRAGASFGERQATQTTRQSPAAVPDIDDPASESGQPALPGARDKGGSGKSGVSLSVSAARPFERESAAKPAELEDLGELDDWDEPDPPRRAPLAGPTAPRPSPEETSDLETDSDTEFETESEEALATAETGAGEAETDEFTVKSAPKSEAPSLSSLRPKLGLTRMEQIGLAVLAVMLVSAAAFALHYTLGRLPTSSSSSERKIDFPVKGNLITVINAETYWREPVTGGDSADIVRRGTLLIPVIELEMTGSSGAVRIFFRDGTGKPIGDPISRTVPPSGKLSAAASAGFEGPGDYAAYSTQETEPWTVEVHEGPSAAALFQEFNKLFEIPVSTYRR